MDIDAVLARLYELLVPHLTEKQRRLLASAAARGHCCICAEGVTDEYLRGDCFHSEGHENGSKRPIVNAL